MRAEIRGETLLVYCDFGKERDKFIDLNEIECEWNGSFKWQGYSGIRTYGDKTGKLVFWFKPEHLTELKFN
jgi:hypothetical protein